MQVWRPLRRWSTTSGITFSSTQAHASIRCCIKSFTSCISVLWTLLNYAPDFVLNCIEVRAVLRPQIWKFLRATIISEIIALLEWRQLANDAQTVWVNTACRKDHSQKNLPKPTLWYRNVYNQIASDIWETDNPAHKLTTDKSQPMLINVLT